MATRSEKRRIEQALPFILLLLTIRGRAITASDDQAELIEKEIDQIIDEPDQRKYSRFQNRVARLNRDCGITDLIKNKVHGHKFILIVYYLTSLIEDRCNVVFPKSIESVFDYFLEAEFNSDLPDQDVEKLRSSARKQAQKLLSKLQSLDYYK